MLSQVLTASYSKRWDSNYFLKEFLNSPLCKHKAAPLSQLFEIKSGTTPSDRDEEIKSGVILLKTNDIRNNILLDKEDKFFYIDDATNLKMQSTQLHANDVLINIVGATTDVIGRVAFINEKFPKANITQAMSLLRVKEGQKLITPHYLFVFLLSKYGHAQVKRQARPTGQYNMNHSEVGSIEIPILSDSFQKLFKKLVSISFDSQLECDSLYKKMELILLEEIGLKDFSPSQNNVNIMRLSESLQLSNRLDAEFYQAKYEEYNSKIKSSLSGYLFVNHEFEQVDKKSVKDKEAYNYIEIGDININDGSYKYNKIPTDDLPANAKYEVEKNDLLISKVRPNRGAVSIINDNLENLIVSGAFLVLRSKGNYPISTLATLFRSQVYKDWFLQYNVGSQYPVIKDEDILKMPIPEVCKSIHDEIKTFYEESTRLRSKANKILEIAKKSIEISIEDGETSALNFISMECKKIGFDFEVGNEKS